MTTTILSTIQDFNDFAHGLIILGTGGGGGSVITTVNLLSEAVGEKGQMILTDIDDLPDDTWTITVAGIGARTEGLPSEDEMNVLGLEGEVHDRLERLTVAVEELAAYGGVELGAVIPAEIGGFNTVAPMLTAFQLGATAIDGDYAGGRAIPEVGQMIPEIYGIPIYPITFVDRWGDVTILKSASSSAMADRIGRKLCEAAFEWVGAAWYLLPASEAKKVIARNSLSTAFQLGKARREALDHKVDPIDAIVKRANGWLLFTGEVLEGKKENQDEAVMFNYGTHKLQGNGEFTGETLEIWYKNENHISWRNGVPFVTSPDLICILDLKTGEGKTTYEVQPGQSVAVVGMKAEPAHRTEIGVNLLGPRHFGFDLDYVPIEVQMKKAGKL